MALNLSRPRPLRFAALSVAFGYAYDQLVLGQGAWDASDYIIVLVSTWFISGVL